MEVHSYLQRMGASEPAAPTAAALRRLLLAHLYHVPFENLDIHRGSPITLELAELVRKIVERGRGGFCYGLNGLFAWLLRELSFEVTLLSARDSQSADGFSPDFAHLMLRVTCPADPTCPDVPWLADIGFGESFLTPLRLDQLNRSRLTAGPHAYRIDQNGAY